MGIMAKPAYSAMGYEPAEVGLVSGVYGAWIVFVGVALAGFSAVKIGLRASLVIGAVISVAGNLDFRLACKSVFRQPVSIISSDYSR